MPWQVTFSQDTEVPGVGTATASFTDDSGRQVVSHSGRLDGRDGATIGGFIDEALSHYQKAMERDTETASVIAKIEAVLNEKTQ